jgi:uncharacterized repeat protein (TIGR02543 family)
MPGILLLTKLLRNTTLYAKWTINTYTVNFDTQGGSILSDTIANYNSKILPPNVPIKTDYIFAGWYKEVDCFNAWYFTTDLVTKNTTLYAKWKYNRYIVSFDSQGGSAVYEVIADNNSSISPPASPVKTNYAFVGWYKESACINEWNFETDIVTSDIKLYAKWTIGKYLVSFNSMGGESISDTAVNYNTIIIAPKAPIKSNCTFAGWYREVDCLNPWNFTNDVVIANTTLYAKWISLPNSIKSPDNINLKLFPNPATNFIKIEGEKLQSVTIFNLLGATQLQLNLHGEGNVNINVGNLISGYYVVEVKTNNGEVTVMKLMKK